MSIAYFAQYPYHGQMITRAYRNARKANNESCRKSRAKARVERSKRHWVITHPDLDPEQKIEAEKFLNGTESLPDKTTRNVLRKHLQAVKSIYSEHYRNLINQLDEMDRVTE